jgi:hypothetical protein
MKIVAMSLVIAVALTGCFASKPPGNVGFARAPSLHDLEGTYENRGEGNPKHDDYPTRLSEIIWPKEPVSFHALIGTIQVRADGETTLIVRAEELGGGLAREQTFTAGKDFEFRSGRLLLHGGWKNSLSEPEAGGLFLMHQSRELGIDSKGEGKYKGTEDVIGAAYLVVPIAVHGTTEVRFVRLKD